MPVDHQSDVLVAIHDLPQARGAEEGVNLRRLADHRVHDRRVVQQHHAAFGTKGADGILDQVGVFDRLLDELLDRSLSERTEHVTTEAADKALAAGETDAPDLIGLSGQHPDARLGHQSGDFVGLAAFMLMIAENPNHGDAAGAQVFEQVLDLACLAEVDQVAAKAEDVGVFVHAVEEVAIDTVRSLADVKVANGGDTQLPSRSGLHAGLRRLDVRRRGHGVPPGPCRQRRRSPIR
ncbi:hypothetical protein D3C72_1363420 [compost metagenome]